VALSASLTGKLGFLAPKSIERDINGAKFKFYAVRVPMVAELLALSGPIATAVSTIFASDNTSRAVKQESTTIKLPEGGEQVIVKSDSPQTPLDVIQYHDNERRAAMERLVSTIVGKDSRNLLARFIADSMRDENIAAGDVETFWNALDIDVAMQFLAGALEANATVIRPFLGKAALNLRGEALLATVREKVAPVLQLSGSPKSAPPVSETTPSTSDAPSSS
jgi:hypothetical protein